MHLGEMLGVSEKCQSSSVCCIKHLQLDLYHLYRPCFHVWEGFLIRGRPLDTSPVFFLLCNRSSSEGGTWVFVTLSIHKRRWEGMVKMRLAQNLAERKGDGT